MRRFTVTLRPRNDRDAARCIRLLADSEAMAVKQAIEWGAPRHGDYWHWIVGPVLAERA